MADRTHPCDAPVLLTRAHDGSAFDSGEPVLDDWLRQRAWPNLQSAASRTYVACPVESPRIAGYFALSMGQILAQDVAGSMRRNMPTHIPAVTLGRLAIDKGWQGMGLGRALLADVVQRALRASSDVAARLVVVHAISPVAERFYLHHGFRRMPVDTPTYGLDLVKIQKLAVLDEPPDRAGSPPRSPVRSS